MPPPDPEVVAELTRRQFTAEYRLRIVEEYTSLAFGKRCREAAVVTSTGSAGDCYDNAMAESFFATLECDLIDRRSFQTRTQARMATIPGQPRPPVTSMWEPVQ